MPKNHGAQNLSAQISIVEEGLVDIRETISAATSPRVRVLRAKLETYERVVFGWKTRPPTQEQCNTLLECVMELHDEVFGRKSGGMWSTDDRSSEPPPAPELSPSERPTKRAPDGPIPPEARRTDSPTSPPPESTGQRPTLRPGGDDDES